MEPDKVGSVVVALQVKKLTFLDEEILLKKLSKEFSKSSKDAIEVLVKMLSSPDDKMRMQAAIRLLEFDVDIKRAISQEQMQRMIAEIKINGGGSKTLELEAASVKSRPVVDFSNIRNIE